MLQKEKKKHHLKIPLAYDQQRNINILYKHTEVGILKNLALKKKEEGQLPSASLAMSVYRHTWPEQEDKRDSLQKELKGILRKRAKQQPQTECLFREIIWND